MSLGLSNLPQELVDHIVDHLHDDGRSLLNCATVCRAWLPPSRVHLFSKVHFELSKSVDERCKRLLAVLDGSPEILPCIHELHIVAVIKHFPLSPGSDFDTFANETLPKLLRRFENVRRVELSSAKGMQMAWHALPHPIQHAFQAIFRLPSLTYVRLGMWVFHSWHSVVSFFKDTPTLRGLALREIEFASTPSVVESLSSDSGEEPSPGADTEFVLEEEGLDGDQEHPPLEFLTLDYVDYKGFEQWMNGPLGISGIREFRLAHSADRCGLNFLHAVGSSLEHLHLKPGTSFYRPQPLSLEHCSNLRSLRLTVEMYPDICEWVLDVISTIPVTGPTQRVAIEFFIDPKTLACWSDLDEALLRLESLSQVAIGVFAHQTAAEFQKVAEDMRGLTERGILRVYQLALRAESQRVCSGLTPTISRFEEC